MLRSLLERNPSPANGLKSSVQRPANENKKNFMFSFSKRNHDTDSSFVVQSDHFVCNTTRSQDLKPFLSADCSSIALSKEKQGTDGMNIKTLSQDNSNIIESQVKTDNESSSLSLNNGPFRSRKNETKENVLMDETKMMEEKTDKVKGNASSFHVPPAYRQLAVVREYTNPGIKHTYPIIRNATTGTTYLLLRTLLHQKRDVRIMLANVLEIFEAPKGVGEEAEYCRTNYNVVIKITTDRQHILSNCYNSNSNYLTLPPLKENPLKEMEAMLHLQDEKGRFFISKDFMWQQQDDEGKYNNPSKYQLHGSFPSITSLKTHIPPASIETARYDSLFSPSCLSTGSSLATEAIAPTTFIPNPFKTAPKDNYFVNESNIETSLKSISYALAQPSIHKESLAIYTSDDNFPCCANTEEQIISSQKQNKEKNSSYIVNLLDYMQDFQNLFMVIPYYPNGDLFQLLKKDSNSKGLSNGQTKKIFRQLLLATLRMKERGICHMDLSIENVMFNENDEAVLIDFGMCYTIEPITNKRTPILKSTPFPPEQQPDNTSEPEMYHTPPASCSNAYNSLITSISPFSLNDDFADNLNPDDQLFYPSRSFEHNQPKRNYNLIGPTKRRGKGSYMCPQVAMEESIDGFAADMWSLGVILFVMCTCTPLYGKPEDNAFLTIMKKGVGSLLNHYETFGLRLDHYARDLVIKLVNPNQDERMTLEEALFHPYLWTDDLNRPFTDYSSDKTVNHYFSTINEKWSLLRNNIGSENLSFKQTKDLYV